MQTNLQTQYLFVYGTLRSAISPNQHTLIADTCDYLAEGSICGKLFEISGYPGAVASNDNSERVFGELYRLTDPAATLSQLDDYEECSQQFPQLSEYVRVHQPVNLADGSSQLAWTYLYNRETAPLKQIASGDYLLYLLRQMNGGTGISC